MSRILVSGLCILFSSVAPGAVVEDFESGSVALGSYPGQDAHPDSWRLDTLVTHDSSHYSLRLWGNTWKVESIPGRQLDTNTVWQVAVLVESLGEIQGFGLASGPETLVYALAGTEEVDPGSWVTVYQGAFPTRRWNRYRLPVGEDWLSRFGRLPQVSALVYVNDRDADPRASCYFDDILDITADLPVAPRVEAWFEIEPGVDNGDGTWSVTARFHSRVIDPDSPRHSYWWCFGDDSTSADSAPVHTYIVRDDHLYTVLLQVRDSTGLCGNACCRVPVEAGPGTLPKTLAFVGDVMVARNYDLPGGIIDTLGPAGVVEPIRPYIDRADIAVCNLECPFTSRGTRHPTKEIAFRGRPGNVAALSAAGFDAVTLANNHIIDYDIEGLLDTRDSLAARGIRFCGAGANSYEAGLPVFLQRSGLNIALLGYSNRDGQYDNYQPYLAAGWDKPGFAYLDTWHIFRRLRELDTIADFTVVEMHSGEEYELQPGAEDEWYSALAVEPDFEDVLFRRRAIDAGADLVICHHPHVLQGFEMRSGRLIAHSLGNFIFDQSYLETQASVILNAELGEDGFAGFTLVPVYIDHLVPRRALGGLGRRILDNLARRSRDLETWVVLDRDSVVARILCDTAGVLRWVSDHSASGPVRLSGEWWTSGPLPLDRVGCISAVNSIAPTGEWQFRAGREAFWHGGFEPEGSAIWLLDQAAEGYDTVARQGQRSMLQTRQSGANWLVTNLQGRLPCYSDSSDHTLYAWLRTENAESARVVARLHSARSGGSPLATANLGTPVSGTTGWTFYSRDFLPPSGTAFWDIWLQSKGPESDTGRAWFDSLGIIEWEQWQPLPGRVPVAEPNDFSWIQVRCATQQTAALVSYEEAAYSAGTGLTSGISHLTSPVRLSVAPNPARTRAAISYNLPRSGRVTLCLYDPLGRLVRTIVSGPQNAGRHAVAWEGTDAAGRRLAAGSYFLRLQADGTAATRKLVLGK